MLKRQESSLSSSRRMAAATPPLQDTRHAKPIGCMSGIFQLFSKYHNSTKRLTFGRKREKCKPSSPAKDKDKPKKDSLSCAKQDKSGSQDYFGSSLEINVPRSPSTPPEVRPSNAVKSPENRGTPSSVVARLMGLEDMNCALKRPALVETGTVSEKRRQLIRALEKCNDDLEGLRRIIQAVQTNDLLLQPPSQAAAKMDLRGGRNELEYSRAVNSCTEERAAVWAEVRATVSGFSEAQNTAALCATRKTHEACPLPHRKPPTASKKPGEDDAGLTAAFLMRSRRSPPIAASPGLRSTSSPKVRTIEEVCKDVAWGERRELGRILVVLQDYICRDLVEEVVKELKSCRIRCSLPLDGCKRRLSF
ncbi:uncharacterized protein [Henckelia pumila]|uniref:uncharacterized protein n=1 Tax=Henckelia pumila TaxID=405737 RepID=UPI003C6E432C